MSEHPETIRRVCAGPVCKGTEQVFRPDGDTVVNGKTFHRWVCTGCGPKTEEDAQGIFELFGENQDGDIIWQNPHFCHWPICEVRVAPKFWGCRMHWYRLPKELRDRIWATYRPGQETDKNPSAAYLAAAREAHRFARAYDKANGE